MRTYINRNMAYDGRVVRQSDVPRVMFVVVALRRARVLVVDDEGALHVYSHRARVQYSLLNSRLRRGRGAAPSCRHWAGRFVDGGFAGSTRRPRLRAGGRRHGRGSRPWLQPRPLASVTAQGPHAMDFGIEVTRRVLGERGG